MSSTDPRVTHVASAIITDREHVYLQRRAPGRGFAGYYELPGGKVEVAETPLDAVLREVREEMRVDLRSTRVPDFHVETTAPWRPGGRVGEVPLTIREPILFRQTVYAFYMSGAELREATRLDPEAADDWVWVDLLTAQSMRVIESNLGFLKVWRAFRYATTQVR